MYELLSSLLMHLHQNTVEFDGTKPFNINNKKISEMFNKSI